MRGLAFLLPLALAACAASPLIDLPTRDDPLPASLPPMKSFADTPSQYAETRANSDIARDFLDLAFEMESGKRLKRMTRFDGPVRVAIASDVSERFRADLGELLVRIRTEAGIDIAATSDVEAAEIVIETVPRRKLQASVPHAACFVVPRVGSWAEFRRNRRGKGLDWTTLERREKAAVFVPEDVSPQEARDCLHEEVAQALGPLNDIYRLGGSVYNDDNINTVLTPFDMLVLRAYYAPELANGMSRDEVAARLPALLKRLNPAGESAAARPEPEASRDWIDLIEKALGGAAPAQMRLSVAKRAVAMAEAENLGGNRLGFSLYVLGRLALGREPATAIEAFQNSYRVYVATFGADDIHSAHVALQLAAFALSSGEPNRAVDLVNVSLPSVARAQNPALMSALLMVKAEALDARGRLGEASAVRLDSLGWARYGFASEDEIRDRLREVAGLRPREAKPEA